MLRTFEMPERLRKARFYCSRDFQSLVRPFPTHCIIPALRLGTHAAVLATHDRAPAIGAVDGALLRHEQELGVPCGLDPEIPIFRGVE